LSATFQLTDKQGKELSRQAQPGDLFKIDIPGPGPVAGKGYDWVQVEKLIDKRNASPEEESLAIRVRPSPSPLTESSDTAHFFDESATSSFIVHRKNNTVTAGVHGRNEVPNTDVEKKRDIIRNAAVGAGAMTLFSGPQWEGLVKGLLDTSIEV
jgi:hypothetical protein